MSADRIDTFIRFFLYVLIFWLPYSPAVVEFCVIICLILWMFKRGIRLGRERERDLKGLLRHIKPESTFLDGPIALFLLACLLSVAGSVFLGQSLHNFFTKTLEWFIVYFLVVEAFTKEKHIYIALAVFLFTAFSTVLDSLIQFYITHKDIFLGHVIGPGGRATAGFKTSNGLGGYLTAVIPGLSAWVFLGKQKFPCRLAALFILFCTVWSLIVTSSRGSWLGTFCGGMFLLLFVLFPKERVQFYFSFGLLLATVVLFMSFLLILSGSSAQEFLDRYQTIGWRWSVWGISAEMIKDRPFFGHGINTFMRIFQSYRGNFYLSPTYAHNCYIQLAAETGLVGLFCFLNVIGRVFHYSLGRAQFKCAQNRNFGVLTAGLLAGILAFLVHSFFDTNWYSLQLSVYLWFLIGVLVSVGRIYDAAREAQN